MSDLLREYEERLHTRDLAFSQGPFPAPTKFTPDGHAKPFYGLTCIAWVDPASELFVKLHTLQSQLDQALAAAGFGDVFALLEPTSFHMTICDVAARSHPIPLRYAEVLIQWVLVAFAKIGAPGPVSAQAQGLGLDTTITAQVRFAQESELRQVYVMEHQIKHAIRQSLRVNPVDITALLSFRPFAGHISLAYCVKELSEEEKRQVREILRRYDPANLGPFTFASFDLTCFTDMNTYIPLLTLHLDDGSVTSYNHLQQCHCGD